MNHAKNKRSKGQVFDIDEQEELETRIVRRGKERQRKLLGCSRGYERSQAKMLNHCSGSIEEEVSTKIISIAKEREVRSSGEVGSPEQGKGRLAVKKLAGFRDLRKTRGKKALASGDMDDEVSGGEEDKEDEMKKEIWERNGIGFVFRGRCLIKSETRNRPGQEESSTNEHRA